MRLLNKYLCLTLALFVMGQVEVSAMLGMTPITMGQDEIFGLKYRLGVVNSTTGLSKNQLLELYRALLIQPFYGWHPVWRTYPRLWPDTEELQKFIIGYLNTEREKISELWDSNKTDSERLRLTTELLKEKYTPEVQWLMYRIYKHRKPNWEDPDQVREFVMLIWEQLTWLANRNLLTPRIHNMIQRRLTRKLSWLKRCMLVFIK